MKFLGRDNDGTRLYSCSVCGSGKVLVQDNLFYGKCDNCGATLIDYTPLHHQRAFHESNAQYRLNIGGFGSGKTTAACAELTLHALSTPNGRSLITAPVLTQVKEAVLPELDKFIPPWYIERKTVNPSPAYRLTNGHEILVFASDDQQKLRSLNLTAFYIEEGSGVDYAIFDQLMTRLRNKAGIIKDKEGNEVGYKYMGIISTNPEDGWVKDKFLLVSSKIVASPSIDLAVYENLRNLEHANKHFHTFISSTRDNNHIPAEFIERMSAGKSAQWIRKYVDCYLDFKEGAVYPQFKDCLIEPFSIPDTWKRVAGFDPGYNDPTAFVIGAIDPDEGVMYIYDDYLVSEQPVSYHAENIQYMIDGISLLYPIQADPAVKQRNNRDGQSYSDYMKRTYHISLEPGNNDIIYGIEKVRDYMYSGKLKIFNSCVQLKTEASKYAYPSKDRNTNDKPVDKNNHTMDAMRYLIARLPQDPNQLSSVVSKFDDFGEDNNTVIGGLGAKKIPGKRSVLGGINI